MAARLPTSCEQPAPPAGLRPLLALAIFGLAWHAFLWSLGRSPELRSLAGDEQTYWARAEVWLAGGEPEVDLMWPPFYARFLSLCWAPLGRPSRLAVELVQVVLLALAAFLLARWARREGLSPGWAAAAGFALFVFPTSAAFAHYFWPEVLHLAIFLAVLELARLEPETARGVATVAGLAGLLLGLALLTKSLLTGFLPLLLLIDFAAAPRRWRWWRLGVMIAGLLLVISPTLIHNQEKTGRVTIADSSTFNLWVGLNDVSRQSHAGSIAWRELQAWRASAPTFAERDQLLAARIAAKVEEDGPARVAARQLGRQYFRLFEKDSYLTDQLPTGTLAPEGQGYRQMGPGLAALLRYLAWGSHLLLLGLAGFGLAFAPLPRRQEPWTFLASAFLVYNLVIFFGLHVKSRYLLQVVPFLLIAAAWGGSRLLAHFGGEEVRPRRPLLVGAILATILLFLATAGPYLDHLEARLP